MSVIETLMRWSGLVLVGFALWQLVGKRFFSAEARERRRRRRNYGPVEYRRSGPAVKLAVKVLKD